MCASCVAIVFVMAFVRILAQAWLHNTIRQLSYLKSYGASLFAQMYTRSCRYKRFLFSIFLVKRCHALRELFAVAFSCSFVFVVACVLLSVSCCLFCLSITVCGDAYVSVRFGVAPTGCFGPASIPVQFGVSLFIAFRYAFVHHNRSLAFR